MAHILVVDDDATTRRFLRDVLEKLLKHTVEEAGSIHTALERANNARFDLMFLDRNLPDGTALELCQTLSQLPGPLSVPKWLITGEKPLDWNPSMWEHYRVQGYMVKPFQIDSIITIITQCLNKPSL